MKIAIGSDHAGYDYRQMLIEHLRAQGHEVVDCGCPDKSSCDYPVYAKQVCDKVLADAGTNAGPGDVPVSYGILICGTGIGMSITANHVPGIRAALCGDCFSAEMCRRHNNANILAMGERVTGPGLAMKICDIFLDTPFDGGRHARRVEKMMAIEDRG